MKIKLLNDGGYEGLQNVIFPVTVDAVLSQDGLYCVSFSKIQSLHNAYWDAFDTAEGEYYVFHDREVEVLP